MKIQGCGFNRLLFAISAFFITLCYEYECTTVGEECWIQFEVFGHKTSKVILSDSMKNDVISAFSTFSGAQFFDRVTARDNGVNAFVVVGAPSSSYKVITSEFVSEYDAGTDVQGEVYPINALIPLMNGIAAAEPVTTVNAENLQAAAAAVTSDVCPEYFNADNMMGISSSKVKVYHTFPAEDGDDLSCYTKMSTEAAFCGTTSRKSDNYIFQANDNNFKKTCADSQQMPFKADTFKYLCLATKGDVNPERLHFIVEYTEKATAKKHERHTWTGVHDSEWEGTADWVHNCINIEERVDSMFVNDKDYFKNFYVKRIYIESRGTDFFYDNVLISKSNPEIENESAYQAALNARVVARVAKVESTTVTQSTENPDNYTLNYSVVF